MNIYPRGDIPPGNGNSRSPYQATTLVPVHRAHQSALPVHGDDIAGAPEARRAKITLLRSFPLLADMPPGDLSRIAEMSSPREYRRRQGIYFPGDPADALYVVIQGRVKISRLSEDGKEVTLFLAGMGEPIGEECLLGTAARETIAEVLESAHVLQIRRDALVPFLHSRPAFALAVANLMSGRRRLAESRLEEMIFRTVRGRLAGLLARLARSHGRATDGGILLDLSLAHQDLAGQIGSTRETTTLTLNAFRRRGLLRIDHCRILIRDLAGLEAIA
jgi:CRP/FNR family transcriptional regulator